jgi:hypothetical protein
MTNAIREFLNILDDMRVIQRKLTGKAGAFRNLYFELIADDLEHLAADLDTAIDRLMENSERESTRQWNEAQKNAGDILSTLLQKSIEEDEKTT